MNYGDYIMKKIRVFTIVFYLIMYIFWRGNWVSPYHMSLAAWSDIHQNKVMHFPDDPFNVYQSPITSLLIEIEASGLWQFKENFKFYKIALIMCQHGVDGHF